MSISVACNECDKSLKVKDEFAGRKLKCPSCGAVIRVPAVPEDSNGDEPIPQSTRPATKKRRGKTRASSVPWGAIAGAGAVVVLLAVVTAAAILRPWAVAADANAPVLSPVGQRRVVRVEEVPWQAPLSLGRGTVTLELPGTPSLAPIDADLATRGLSEHMLSKVQVADGSLTVSVASGALTNRLSDDEEFVRFNEGYRQTRPQVSQGGMDKRPGPGRTVAATAFTKDGREVGLQAVFLDRQSVLVLRCDMDGNADFAPILERLTKSITFSQRSPAPLSPLLTPPAAAVDLAAATWVRCTDAQVRYEVLGPGEPKRVSREVGRKFESCTWNFDRSALVSSLRMVVTEWNPGEVESRETLPAFARNEFARFSETYQRMVKPATFEVIEQTWEGLPAIDLLTTNERGQKTREWCVYTPEAQIKLAIVWTGDVEPAEIWERFRGSLKLLKPAA